MSLGPGTSELTPTLVDPPRVAASIDTVRLQFDRRAARFGSHDALVREIEARLLERLNYIRIDPRRIVDVGCGAGHSRQRLAQRFASAAWIGADLSRPMLTCAAARASWPQRWRRWWSRGAPQVATLQADAAHLPLADGCADLVLSNLMLHWHPQPHVVFPEWKRVLRVDGLLLFSSFGPDTIRQLRSAFCSGWPQARPMPYVDMHDFGDMMVGAGFANPVMDVEVLHLTYPTAQALLREVAALGGNPRQDRPGGLPSTRQARAVIAALDAQRGADGRITLSFEVAYGYGHPAQPGMAVCCSYAWNSAAMRWMSA